MSIFSKGLAMAFVLCIACKEPITETTHYRIIKNENSYTATLFVSSESEELDYTIAPGDSAIIKGTCYAGPGIGHCDIGWNEIENVSGKLTFEDIREIVYSSPDCTGGKNPLAFIATDWLSCGYSEQENEGRSEYVISITDEDFEDAEEIN